MEMSLPYVTISWVGLTSLTPLSALIIAWTLVSIHRKRTKSILLLAIVYAQLFFQFIHFAYSTLTLLKLETPYSPHFLYTFNTLLIFKSLSVLSLHLEEFYKIKSPSNYLLNINSSLLKYHLLVVLLLSLMGSYLLGGANIVPPLSPTYRFTLAAYVTFHTVTILLSLFFLALKSLRRKTLDVNMIIGTNSTSSSANLFGIGSPSGRGNGRQGIAASGVAAINLLINSTLLMCTFSKFWLPPIWPLINIILWAQAIESILTPSVYWSVHGCRRRRGSSKGHESSGARHLPKQIRSHSVPFHQSLTNGSLCFNNGEFQYFAGGKHSSSREGVLNNGLSSEYNTYDSSFHQPQSYDSLRCASVTTVANDDFEFLPRGHLNFQAQNQPNFHFETITINKHKQNQSTSQVHPLQVERRKESKADKVTASLSMNDLDLIECRKVDSPNSTDESGSNDSDAGKYKYKKNAQRIKKRFTNKGLTRRVLSLESLHSNVNESTLAYLDTGERVIVFTTDFI